ncbi:hypothetical protein B0H14DRAFT_3497833 [Mycena olivaceomarginata]|nr:hypothetical protein B0H14DRAFT_3497833 [Mycena olivaceomarginata]
MAMKRVDATRDMSRCPLPSPHFSSWSITAQSEVLKPSNKKALDKKSFVNSSEEANYGIHDGLVFSTEEERLTLCRASDRIRWNAYPVSTFPCCLSFSSAVTATYQSHAHSPLTASIHPVVDPTNRFK